MVIGPMAHKEQPHHRNHLLRALPPREQRTVERNLEAIDAVRGTVLLDVGERVRFMYFPETAVLSISQPYASGSSVEVAAVGCEGMICIASALENGGTSAARHLVQIEGRIMRMRRDNFDTLFASQPNFRKLIHHFAAGFIAGTLLSIACNRLHTVEPRLARWLLVTLDRSTTKTLPLTHEIMAEMLGVHRPTLTIALQSLVKTGALTAARGRVEILDRSILEAIACECYSIAVKRLPAGCGT